MKASTQTLWFVILLPFGDCLWEAVAFLLLAGLEEEALSSGIGKRSRQFVLFGNFAKGHWAGRRKNDPWGDVLRLRACLEGFPLSGG